MAAAAGDGTVKPLQSAMKLANGAIELDAGNRPREAYTEYLRSIHYISQVLLEEVETTKAGETMPPDTSKMLKLAQQCLERAQSTAAKLGKTCLKPAMPAAAPNPQPAGRHRRVYSDEGGKLSPFLPPEIFQKLQGAESQSSKKELTPLEEASLQNQKLKAAYEARMARLDPSQAMQKTSLTLSLQRQMMENLVIAKAREETLQRKMEERRLRLQEAANRRFCSQVALTPEEREQRALYAAILEYEQDHDWPKHWKAKLKRSPGDLSLVTSLLSHLLSLPDHPIAQLLRRLQCAVYSTLYPAVSRAAAPAPGCCPPTPNPGSRRLRPSQSLHCMLSPSEPSTAPQPQDSPPTPSLHPRAAGPPSPVGDITSGLPDKDSSFEDLEQFLRTSEPQGRGRGHGGQPEPQLQQLKSAVEDIHNAIAQPAGGDGPMPQPFSVCKWSSRDGVSPPWPGWPQTLDLSRQAALADPSGLRRPQHSCLQGPLPSVHRGALLLPAVASAAGPVQECAPSPGGRSEQEHGALQECTPHRHRHPHQAPPQGPGGQGDLPLLRCGPGAWTADPGELPPKEAGVHRLAVRTLRVICVCAEDYCPTSETTSQAGLPPIAAAAIGADDLLPILSFVVLRSGLPQLVSECAALEEFIHEGYLIGEEGYCLTSLQSALSYVELLPRGGLAKQ
ncbi:VPS9 domain-containing protein 1 isoform X3 [Sapajus apella]|uniref:VPS9 domain-containing protein 1 isoform X3 n=1 Tax=Sapajus apella TaxID=9515 RepID=A0A6J3IE71_SAPAP|nr:VPS9 domain-containing protein 1 isoform X3 [Sapajus apella]